MPEDRRSWAWAWSPLRNLLPSEPSEGETSLTGGPWRQGPAPLLMPRLPPVGPHCARLSHCGRRSVCVCVCVRLGARGR